MFLENVPDATPITPEEAAALIPAFIATRTDLNIAEQRNILSAERWAFRRRENVLTEPFLRKLHFEMFGEVWTWAGQYRTTARNLGIDAWRIPSALIELLDNVRFWLKNSVYTVDEVATRFHHQLVWIHPFPNGNGRHARLAADLLLTQHQQPRLSWGRASLQETTDTRKQYIAALRAADNHDLEPLLKFVRT